MILTCYYCKHNIMVSDTAATVERDFQAFCPDCKAVYHVSITELRATPLTEEELSARCNRPSDDNFLRGDPSAPKGA